MGGVVDGNDALYAQYYFFFFFSSRRRHTRYIGDWSSDVCSSDLLERADLRRVEIQAKHFVPDFGETGAAHQADVARADDGDLQIWPPGFTASARIPHCASADRFPSRRRRDSASRTAAP